MSESKGKHYHCLPQGLPRFTVKLYLYKGKYVVQLIFVSYKLV